MRQTADVSIDDDAGRDSVSDAEYHVRRLARDAGKFEQFFHRFRNFAIEYFDQHLARALNRFRFVAKEASSLDVLL